MTIHNFTDLIAWQEGHNLTLLVYKITSTFPSDERFNLTSQLRRAAVSIESCIAEGYGRFHFKDRINFYYDSRGSLSEVESQMIDALDLGFLTKDAHAKIQEQIRKVEILLNGLIRSTRNQT